MVRPRVVHVVIPNRYKPVGGVVKVFDYVTHLLALGWHVSITSPEPVDRDLPLFRLPRFGPLLDDKRVTFRHDPGLRGRLDIREQDLVLISLPDNFQVAYRSLPTGMSPYRIVHYIQNVRHTNPEWRDAVPLRTLTYPASRISTMRMIGETIEPWLDPRGLHRVIEIGHDVDYFARQRPEDTAPRRVAYTTWKTDLGDRVAELAREAGDDFEFRAIRENVGWDRLRELYHWADVFLCTPYPQEGHYLPGVEAMAAGCLVVTADAGGNMSYSRPDENCLLVPHEDEVAYLGALRTLRDADPGVRRSLRDAGYETVHDIFSLDRERRELGDFIDEVSRRVDAAEGRVDLERLLREGRDAALAEDWARSREIWQTVIDHADEPPAAAYFRVGQACRVQGDLEASRDVLLEGRRRNPDNVSIAAELGRTATELDDPELIVGTLTEYLDQVEAPPAALWLKLISVHDRNGDRDTAEAVLAKARARQPEDPELAAEAGKRAAAVWHWRDAAEAFRLALDHADLSEPGSAHLYSRLANALRMSGNLDEAESVVRRGLEQHPRAETILVESAQVAMAREDFPTAVDQYRALVAAVEEPAAAVWYQFHLALREVGDAAAEEVFGRYLATRDEIDYATWVERFETEPGPAPQLPVAVLRAGTDRPDEALDAAAGGLLVVLEPGARLAPGAEAALAAAAASHPDRAVLYGDEDTLVDGERRDPVLKPAAWDPDLALGQDLFGGLVALRADAVDPAVLADAVGRPYAAWRLGLRAAAEHGGAVHLARVLHHRPAEVQQSVEDAVALVAEHLAAYAPEATAEAAPHGAVRVRWPLPEARPPVSVVIPTRDRVGLLRDCLTGVLERTDYRPVEIVVVDNGSVEPETLAYLERLRAEHGATVVRDDGDFNFSRLVNAGVRAATGEVVVLLNNDTDVRHPDWLEELVSQALRPEVGVVGAKLLFRNGTVQHAGVVLGIRGLAGHAHKGWPGDHPGYAGRLAAVQAYSAVTGACLAVRRELYEKLGGLDEDALPVNFSDVDMCLKARAAGHRVLWTPFAELNHYESISRGRDESAEEAERTSRERAHLLERWGDVVAADPCFSPHLSLGTGGFALGRRSRAAGG